MKSTKKTTSATKRNTRGKPAKRRRYSKSVRRVVAASVTLLSILAVCCIAVGGYGWYLLNKINIDDDNGSLPSDFSYPEGEGPESIPDISFDSDPYENATTVADIPVMGDTEDVTNILLIGIDGRTNYSARSDSNMIVYINKKKKTIKFVSLLRDTCVTIPGRDKDGDGKDDYNKLNAAYAFGGPSEAVKTLSTFAGVPITHYVEVHFEELKDVVNELGGIQVNVPESFYSDTSGISLEAGEQTLDGDQALAFARERHAVSGGDFSRAQAQRMIIEAIVEKVLAASPTEIPGTVESLARCVTTDYSVTDLVSLALTFKDKGLTMYSAACPSYTLNQDGISYVGTQYKEWQDMMRRVDAGLDPADTSVEIPEPQASDTELGAATNARSPQDYEGLLEGAMTTDDVKTAE